jgi:O-antigen ligase
MKGPQFSIDRNFILLSAIFICCLAVSIYTSSYWVSLIPFILSIFIAGWIRYEFIFYLLIISLPWSIEFHFNPTLGTDLPDEPLMVLTAALFLFRFVSRPRETTYGWDHPLIIILLSGFAWTLITIFFSTDWLVSLKYFIAKGWYLAAFVFTGIIIFRNKKGLAITGLLFAISMVAFTVFALWRHYELGFTFARINDAVQPFFRNHVNYSAMLVCCFPVLLAVYMLHKRSRFFILLAMMIVVTALFFSYARGAWLALLAGISAWWLIRKKLLFYTYLVSVVLVIAALFWLKSGDRYLDFAHDFRTTIFHKNFEEHLIATYQLKDVSTAERFNRWIAGVRMVRDKWITGYGPNSFYENYKSYSIPAFKTWVSSNKDHSTVHNYFLLLMIEQGLPGLIFFLVLVGAMFYYAERLYEKLEPGIYRIASLCCGSMLAMIVVVNFLSDLIETDKVGSLFYLCVAALVAISLGNRPRDSEKS